MRDYLRLVSRRLRRSRMSGAYLYIPKICRR
jgi:hypothetical protein